MKRLRLISAILLAVCAFAAVSCGKGIKPRPAAANTSGVLKKKIAIGKHQPSALERFNLNFWDSLDIKAFPDPETYPRAQRYATASIRSSETGSSRLHAAYRLGIAFASKDPEQVSQRQRLLMIASPSVSPVDSLALERGNVESLFLKCVSKADTDNEHGLAAVMISGYYFGNLCKILQNVNPDTKFPDEKTVQSAISRIDNLKKYINEALTSEKDVNTTMLLQNIQASADSITASYAKLPFNSKERFQNLLDDVRNIDNCFE